MFSIFAKKRKKKKKKGKKEIPTPFFLIDIEYNFLRVSNLILSTHKVKIKV